MSDDNDSEDKDVKSYDVGYGKPPKEHRFKKDEPSRNSKGRPKGSKNMKTYFTKTFMNNMNFNVNGKSEKAVAMEMVMRRLLDKAMKGCNRSLETIIKMGQKFDLIEENAQVLETVDGLTAKQYKEKYEKDIVNVPQGVVVIPGPVSAAEWEELYSVKARGVWTPEIQAEYMRRMKIVRDELTKDL